MSALFFAQTRWDGNIVTFELFRYKCVSALGASAQVDAPFSAV